MHKRRLSIFVLPSVRQKFTRRKAARKNVLYSKDHAPQLKGVMVEHIGKVDDLERDE